MDLEIHPLTLERWAELEALFGPHGAFGGCWCMWFRQTNKEWEATSGSQRKTAMQAIVETGAVPGLVAYDGGKPVGWMSLGPRSDFHRLDKSRAAKPVDQEPVWSVVCFYVARSHRRMGVTVALLEAGIEFARQRGAKILEGYPVDPETEKPDEWVYHGLVATFKVAGFVEVARHLKNRPIMRYFLETK
jgi:GNAT superfamily N-acetyltransferase